MLSFLHVSAAFGVPVSLYASSTGTFESSTTNNLLNLKVKLVNLCSQGVKPSRSDVQVAVKYLEDTAEVVSFLYWYWIGFAVYLYCRIQFDS